MCRVTLVFGRVDDWYRTNAAVAAVVAAAVAVADARRAIVPFRPSSMFEASLFPRAPSNFRVIKRTCTSAWADRRSAVGDGLKHAARCCRGAQQDVLRCTEGIGFLFFSPLLAAMKQRVGDVYL